MTTKKLLANLEAKVKRELKRRNGEVLQFLLSQPRLSGVVVTEDDGEYEEHDLRRFANDMQHRHALDRLVNEGGKDRVFFDPDDYCSGEGDYDPLPTVRVKYGFPHYVPTPGFERTE